MIGHFVCLESKNNGDIYPTIPVIYNERRGIEYLRKIRLYLPQMLPMINGEVDAEYYPRRTLYSFNSPCGMCEYRMLCLDDNYEGFTLFERTVYRIPFVSPTEIIKWEICPRQWAYERSGIRSSIMYAKKEFGTVVHASIEAYIKERIPPEEVFEDRWGAYKNVQLEYSQKCSFEDLRVLGNALMKKFPSFWKGFVKEKGILSCTTEMKSYRTFEDFALTGRPDAVCTTSDGTVVVLDWKIISKKYDDSWVRVSDQMTGYFLLVANDVGGYDADKVTTGSNGCGRVVQGV